MVVHFCSLIRFTGISSWELYVGRGEYGSYFCRRILHVDVFPVIPDVSFSPNVKASLLSGKDGPRAAHNLFEANAV